MAETDLILLRDGVERILDGVLASDAKLAVGRVYKESRYEVVEPGKYDCLLQGNFVQLFVKHASFSSVDFQMLQLNEEAYVVDQFAWDGHLSITIVARFGSTPQLFLLGIRRKSYFLRRPDNEYFRFSNEIDGFYKFLARLAKKGTKHTEIKFEASSRYYWIDRRIFDLSDRPLERIRFGHRGPTQNQTPN